MVENLLSGLDDMSYHTLAKKKTIKDTAKFTYMKQTDESKLD